MQSFKNDLFHAVGNGVFLFQLSGQSYTLECSVNADQDHDNLDW